MHDEKSIIFNQNDPNPFSEETTISYFIPENANNVKILFYSNTGVILKTLDIPEKGEGAIKVYASDLSSGMYMYSIVSEGKIIDSKRMMKGR